MPEPTPSPALAPTGAPSPDGPPRPRHRSAARSLWRLWPYIRPVSGWLALGITMSLLGTCGTLVVPLLLKHIVDGPVAHHDEHGVLLGGLLVLVVGVLEAGFYGARRWVLVGPMTSVEARLRAEIYERVQRLPAAFHARWSSGQLLSRATGDLQEIRMFLSFPLVFLVVNSSAVVLGYLVLLVQHWTLGLALVLPVAPLVVICSVFERRHVLVSREARDRIGDLATLVEESVLGIRIIKAFGRHERRTRAFRRGAEELRGVELRKAALLSTLWALVGGLPDVALAVTLVTGSVQVADGRLSAGTLVAFLSTALVLRWPVESIGWLLAMANEGATATDRVFEVLDTPLPVSAPPLIERPPARPARPGRHGLQAPPPPVPAPAPPPAWNPPRPGDGLRLRGVRFRHPDAPPGTPDLLDGIDLHVPAGRSVALVGATGSGKTTLTALVPRLLEPTGGTLTLDGADTAALALGTLRGLVSTAFEDPTLFSASVRENVLMGAPAGEATSDEELLRALEIAQCGFVHELPEGVHTQVGEQGLSLSGGQRQRLALARAVVGRPRFLVLDDPLSALDVHTEALVEAALRRVLATTTALVVAHRPSTVLLADRVAVLSGGRIAAVGTHADLLRDSAEYRRLMSGTPDAAPEAAPAARDRTDERSPAR
jgi:ATP-binding cassette subfamily B protein